MPAVKLLDTGVRQRLDRYELVGELASGGMATVFLGRIAGVGGFQRFVAIKRLHPHLATEQEFVEMFIDEARLAAGIHHPNVVPILDIGTSERGYYLVMEYIEGDTLARLLARAATSGERLPVPIAIRIILDTLAGLHAAHELRDDQDKLLGLVHRDVSPQNVLVGVDGTARITDFGVARASARLTSTRAGQLKGKLAYMAPEQAKGKDVDRRADVFAMGTVVWEVLAGKRLFKAEDEAATLNRVLFEPIPKLRDADPSLPAALEAVTMKALDRDPDKRFASCSELADALERAGRATRSIASARDVASYVQKLLGQDIQAQREAVRAWIAASEPSRTQLADAPIAPPPTAAEPTATTSSVSSAAISIRPENAQPLASGALAGPTAHPPPKKRQALIAAAVIGGGLLFGLVVWGATRSKPNDTGPSAAVAPTAAPPPTTTASVAEVVPSAAPTPPASASAAPVESAQAATDASAKPEKVEPAPATTPARTTGGGRRGRPSPGTSNPSSDDDISHNPYR